MAIQVNFPKEGGHSAFTYSVRDCVGSPDVVFDQTTYTWIALNKTTTQVTISASQVPDSQITSRSGRVNIKVDGTTCENFFEVLQAGNICDCSTAIITGASSVVIPQSGGTNIEVGRYTADTNCVTISASGVSDQSWLTNVTLANGIVKADLTPNYNASRSATITIAGTMKSDSSKCTKTIGITQPGLSCDCTTAFVATPGTVTQAGSAGASVQIGTYTSDATCIQTVSGSGASSESWISNVTVSGDKVNGIVAANTGTASRSTTITVKATMKNGTECPKTFILTQPGLNCDCTTAFTVTAGSVAQGGSAGASVEIGTYSSDATCIQTVSGTGTSSESWITNVTVSGGKINGVVAANTGTASRTTTITTKATLKNGTECPKTFTLTQPALSCTCASSNFTVSAKTTSVGSGSSSDNIIVWTADCGSVTAEVISGNSWLSIDQSYVSSNYRYFEVTTNTGAQRQGIIKVCHSSQNCCSSITITQAAGDSPTPSCSCSDLTLTSIPYSANSLDSGLHQAIEIGNYNVNSCITNITLSSDVYWLHDITKTQYNGWHITANVDPNGGITPRVATITISYSANGTSCSNTFEVHQDGQSTTCACSSLYVETGVTFASASGSYDDASMSGNCGTITVEIPSSAQTWLGYNVYSSSIRFSAKTANESTDARSTSVRILEAGTDQVTCERYVVVTQNGEEPCTCSKANFAVSPTSISVASSGATSTSPSRRISWTADCGTVTAEVTSGNEWLGFHSTTGSKYRYITASTNTSSERVGTVKVSLDGDSSCYSSVTVTQAAGTAPCYCSGFTITNAPYSSTPISNSSAKGEEIGYFSKDSCIASISLSSNTSWIYSLGSDSGKIYGDIAANATGSIREAIITVRYTAGSSSCTRTFKVRQAGCPSMTINPNNGSTTSFGGIQQFTIIT
jgi:hypothetical protein